MEGFSLSHIPSLTATQMVDALTEWDGVDSTISVFQDLIATESSQFKELIGTFITKTLLILVRL